MIEKLLKNIKTNKNRIEKISYDNEEYFILSKKKYESLNEEISSLSNSLKKIIIGVTDHKKRSKLGLTTKSEDFHIEDILSNLRSIFTKE